ncbi:MAG: hypothetical protein V4584_12150 [Verrucomicrobiota bacterium]
MNPISLAFFIACALALLSVPRKWAPAALLVGCTYMTLGQGIEIGSINLPVYRMMLLVGLIRVMLKGERIGGGLNTIDKLVLVWSLWSIFAGFFHDQERYSVIYFCGGVFNVALIYFLIRIWCNDIEEAQSVIAVVAVILVPIAIEMLLEKSTGKNLFSFLGGVPENVYVREGKLRAQGPFLHAILAGTVGATSIPLFIGLFGRYRIIATLGIAAGVIMTFASASSGPVMSLLAGSGALMLWRYRQHVYKLRIACVLAYLVLMVTMAQPPYYLISRIDISGGSTGWHRSFLIDQTFKHLSEWWLFGTDITRHWMPMQGIASDPQHTDITNYYIGFGVAGGLAAMVLVIVMLLVAFKWVGKTITTWGNENSGRCFMIWCFGATLFAHAATSISVAYFDQSVLYFWLSLAVISSIHSISQLGEQEPELSEFKDHFGDDFGGLEIPALTAGERNREWREAYRRRLSVESGESSGARN